MGTFSNKDTGANDSIDVFLGQKILTPKVFLTHQGGESTDEGGVSKKAFFIRSDKTVLGEVSEFDRKA
jgi:hypothetical protein